MTTQRKDETREEWLDRNRSSFRHWRQRNPERSLFRLAIKRARERGTRFELSIEDVVIPELCPVLGIPLRSGTRLMKDSSPTLDEVTPGKGYIRGNVRVISWRANRLKSDATIDELRKLLRYCEEAS